MNNNVAFMVFMKTMRDSKDEVEILLPKQFALIL